MSLVFLGLNSLLSVRRTYWWFYMLDSEVSLKLDIELVSRETIYCFVPISFSLGIVQNYKSTDLLFNWLTKLKATLCFLCEDTNVLHWEGASTMYVRTPPHFFLIHQAQIWMYKYYLLLGLYSLIIKYYVPDEIWM